MICPDAALNWRDLALRENIVWADTEWQILVKARKQKEILEALFVSGTYDINALHWEKTERKEDGAFSNQFLFQYSRLSYLSDV